VCVFASVHEYGSFLRNDSSLFRKAFANVLANAKHAAVRQPVIEPQTGLKIRNSLRDATVQISNANVAVGVT
jgi:nitrogen fixation/metabolism regulation signal transduction histidine kinase